MTFGPVDGAAALTRPQALLAGGHRLRAALQGGRLSLRGRRKPHAIPVVLYKGIRRPAIIMSMLRTIGSPKPPSSIGGKRCLRTAGCPNAARPELLTASPTLLRPPAWDSK